MICRIFPIRSSLATRGASGMNVIQKVTKHIVPGVTTLDRPDRLSDIHDPGAAAVIWSRQPSPAF